MSNEKIEQRLKEELLHLQNRFGKGFGLSVRHLPNKVRYNENGRVLSGEINGDLVLIYEDKLDKALLTLNHEFIEYLIIPLIRGYLDVINYQNKIITKLLCDRKETLVESLIRPLQ